LADMACDAREFRSTVRAMGAIPIVPREGAKDTPAALPCPHRHRDLIERCWSRLKELRGDNQGDFLIQIVALHRGVGRDLRVSRPGDTPLNGGRRELAETEAASFVIMLTWHSPNT